MKKIYPLMIILILSGIHATGQSLEDDLNGHIDIIVDATGDGDFTTINAALAAVPDNSFTTTVIFIRKGTYEEKVEIPASKSNLTLIGEDIDETVISYNDYSGSGEIYNGILNYKGQEIRTSTSHTLYAAPPDFLLMNLTIANTAGRVGQAVAVNLHGDRQTIAYCRILGNQDTFYTWGDGRFYIKDSYIEGNVDFIFGRGVAYFENCLIVSNRSDSDITAASTDEGWNFGYVFNHCKLEGLPGISGVTMGRPWRPTAQVVFLNSKLGAHIAEDGWSEWSGNNNHETAFYAVYNNTGPGSQPESYLEWTHVLTENEASEYTMDNLFSNNVRPDGFAADWTPELGKNNLYSHVDDHAIDPFADTLYYLPLIKSVSYKGRLIEEYDPNFSLYTVIIHEESIEKEAIEVKTMDPEADVEIKLPNTVPGNASLEVTSRNGNTSNYLLKFWYEPLSITPQEQVNIYPNPFQNYIQIKFGDLKANLSHLTIFNISGARILDKKIDMTNSSAVSFDASAFPPGVYTYTLKSREKVISGRLIKHE